MEQLIETNSLLIPCVSDDAFIDKKTLYEPLSGKDFNEIYKTFLVAQSEEMEKEKVIAILTESVDKNELDKNIVKLIIDNYEYVDDRRKQSSLLEGKRYYDNLNRGL